MSSLSDKLVSATASLRILIILQVWTSATTSENVVLNTLLNSATKKLFPYLWIYYQNSQEIQLIISYLNPNYSV